MRSTQSEPQDSDGLISSINTAKASLSWSEQQGIEPGFEIGELLVLFLEPLVLCLELRDLFLEQLRSLLALELSLLALERSDLRIDRWMPV